MSSSTSNPSDRATPAPRAMSAWVATLLRWGLAAVLLPAGVSNVIEVEAFVATVDGFQLLPARAAVWLAIVLPWIGCGAGLGLLFGAWTRANALLAALLVVVASVACGSAVVRDLYVPCACPPFIQSSAAGWPMVVGLALPAIPALLVWRLGPGRMAVDTAFRRESA